jgi:hypothetical protein
VKIYVASSWRNEFQPEVVRKLRALGHEVYDFREEGDGWGSGGSGAGGFGWKEIDVDWQSWGLKEYLKALQHPRAEEGFRRDMDALRRADACIMVMPCGPSASMEMGYAVGAGKLVAVYCPAIREPDLMIKMASHITERWSSIELWLNIPLEV